MRLSLPKQKKLNAKSTFFQVGLECSECTNQAVKTINGETYCKVCASEFHKCDDCGDMVLETSTIYSTGSVVCESCLEDSYTYCEKCNEYELNDDTYTVYTRNNARGAQLWCSSCVDTYAYTCEDCGDIYSSDDTDDTYVGRRQNHTICYSCYENGEYFTCEDCGDTLSMDDYEQDGVCCSCYEDKSSKGKIKKYHDGKNNVQFFGVRRKLSPFIGFELEVECSRLSPNEVADNVDGLEQFRLEEDGSLNNGFEIISHALTYSQHKKRFTQYEKIFSDLQKSGCTSHDTSTCGLHFHISKKNFNNSEMECLVNFFKHNKSHIERFSRRSENNYCKYNNFEDSLDTRYSAVNLTNRDTIEFRVFKGTLNFETFKATMQFVSSIHLYITNTKNFDISFHSYLDFLQRNTGKKYTSLIWYMKKRKIIKTEKIVNVSDSVDLEQISA